MASIGSVGDSRYIRKEYGLADYEQEPKDAYIKEGEGKENADNE